MGYFRDEGLTLKDKLQCQMPVGNREYRFLLKISIIKRFKFL